MRWYSLQRKRIFGKVWENKRLMRKYRVEDMKKTYSDIYWKFEDIDW